MNNDIFKKLSSEYTNISESVETDELSKNTTEDLKNPNIEDELTLENDPRNDIVFDVTSLLKHWQDAPDADKITTEWLTGERVRKALYGVKDRSTGSKILKGLAEQSAQKLGDLFDLDFIHHCLKVSESFPELSILNEISSELSREQFLMILELNDDQERLYFTEMCKLQKWTSEQLKSYIELGLNETQKQLEDV